MKEFLTRGPILNIADLEKNFIGVPMLALKG